jgi:uracil-DNA glycosylase
MKDGTMPDTPRGDGSRADIARLAKAFLKQSQEIDDPSLWPSANPDAVAEVQARVALASQPAPPPTRSSNSKELPDPMRTSKERSTEPPQRRAEPPASDRPTVPSQQGSVSEPPADAGSEPLDTSTWDGLTLEQFDSHISECTRCPLHENANNFVFGRGSSSADIMFIGEAPGEEEDKTGKPFVGRAGKLLDKMIVAMKLDPEADVYIANVVKHRPPKNRNPRPDEVEACIQYLERQIDLVKPKLICLLGRVAALSVLDSSDTLGNMRQKWHDYRGTPVLVTYHPAALLRNPNWKKPAWDDLKMLRKELDGTEL